MKRSLRRRTSGTLICGPLENFEEEVR